MRSYLQMIVIAMSCVIAGGACNKRTVDTTDEIKPETAPQHEFKEQGQAGSMPLNLHIVVDQFGYRPDDPKVAVIRDPKIGYDSQDGFVPGSTYQVRSADDGQSVLSGQLVAWDGGAVDTASGDRGWWFDFSGLTTPGRYFVYDVERNVRSAVFRIDQGVYREILKAATRMYFYQRSGFAKRPPQAESCWTDAAAYLGKDQDIQARDVTDKGNINKVRNLSGGWFDAGDTNKYVTFALQPVQQLLTAYEQYPTAFTDDLNIPESGNGIPDIVDEVKWEMDWLRRMQFPDGSVALKVGVTKDGNASPPSGDRSERYYIPACTSATISAAAMFAHAAQVFGKFPALSVDADDLRIRATRAWNSYQGVATKQVECDSGVIHAGDADLSEQDQAAVAVEAAIYLFSVTGNPDYSDYVKNHFRETRPYRDTGWSRYQADQGESLLLYTTLPGADETARRDILADKRTDATTSNGVYGTIQNHSLYQAYMHPPQYHWGSNNPRANYGNSNLDVIHYGIDQENETDYRQRALQTLHYFHGVNPFGMVYLSNMYAYGATKSANRIYHTWFKDGSKWSDAKMSSCGPAPGYVVGGPNASAEENGVPSKLRPPTGQPPEKSYRDWNAAWPENSWTVTEPSIYYQSAYVKLLAAFAQ
ncbi:MAG: glycoside hydrolase family 9 protein [Steroidobacteraceae bacterium]